MTPFIFPFRHGLITHACVPDAGLQSRCNSISPTILSTRIKDLIEAKLIERTLDGYRLTKAGEGLFVILEPFRDWALKWAKTLK